MIDFLTQYSPTSCFDNRLAFLGAEADAGDGSDTGADADVYAGADPAVDAVADGDAELDLRR